MEPRDAYHYDKYKFKLLHDKALLFNYKYVFVDSRENNDELLKDREETYVCYFSNANVIFKSNMDADEAVRNSSLNSRADFVESRAGDLAIDIHEDFTFPYVAEFCIAKGGTFRRHIQLDSVGKIIYAGRSIYYINDYYGDIGINGFDVDDFSPKEKAINILKTIEYGIQKKEEEIEKEKLGELLKYSIKLSKLNAICRNQLEVERNYLGKELIIDCDLETVDHASGLFDASGYRYKLCNGSWFSSISLSAYTNDENFTRLSYPCRVVMRGVFYAAYGDENVRRFDFRNCQLLYVFP